MKQENWVFFICLMILLCVCLTGCGPQSKDGVTPYIRYVDSHDGVQVAVPEHTKTVFYHCLLRSTLIY